MRDPASFWNGLSRGRLTPTPAGGSIEELVNRHGPGWCSTSAAASSTICMTRKMRFRPRFLYWLIGQVDPPPRFGGKLAVWRRAPRRDPRGSVHCGNARWTRKIAERTREAYTPSEPDPDSQILYAEVIDCPTAPCADRAVLTWRTELSRGSARAPSLGGGVLRGRRRAPGIDCVTGSPAAG